MSESEYIKKIEEDNGRLDDLVFELREELEAAYNNSDRTEDLITFLIVQVIYPAIYGAFDGKPKRLKKTNKAMENLGKEVDTVLNEGFACNPDELEAFGKFMDNCETFRDIIMKKLESDLKTGRNKNSLNKENPQ